MHLYPKKAVASAVIGFGMILPLAGLAQTSTATSTPKGKNLCTQIDSVTAQYDQQFAAKQKKLDDTYDKQSQQTALKRADNDKKLADTRAKGDDQQNQNFEKLQGKAKNAPQSQALTAYESAITAAVTARRTAIDAALKAFRDGMDQALAVRKPALDTAVKTFQDTGTTAITAAKANCANGTDVKTVRTTLAAALKAARDKFQADRKAVPKLNTATDQLATARKAAIDKTMADFKAAAEKARATLKAALKATSSTTKAATGTPALVQ